MKEIIYTILFGIGILFSLFEIIKEYKKRREESKKAEETSYKIKYISLWIVIFAYIIYMQWFGE